VRVLVAWQLAKDQTAREGEKNVVPHPLVRWFGGVVTCDVKTCTHVELDPHDCVSWPYWHVLSQQFSAVQSQLAVDHQQYVCVLRTVAIAVSAA